MIEIKIILKSVMRWITILVGTLVLFFCGYIVLFKIQEFIFVPKDYFMWTFNSPQNKLIFVLEIILIIFIIYKVNLHKEKKNDFDFYKKSKLKWKKYKKKFIIISVILLYAVIVDVSVIGFSEIKTYSFFKPLGKAYSLKDIKYINAGVYGSRIPYIRNKGEFYYKINFNDGSVINLNDSLGSTKEEMDTYLEIEKLDRYFVSKGIEKNSSMANIEYLELDKQYVDRFKRILQ